MSNNEVFLEEHPWMRLLPDFIFDLRHSLLKDYGEHMTDMRQCVNAYSYDEYALDKIAAMYKEHKLLGKPVPWARIGVFAFLGWLRRKHPGIVAHAILENNK